MNRKQYLLGNLTVLKNGVKMPDEKISWIKNIHLISILAPVSR
jgi:hypothetical protein